jgi:hypothetical protein
MESVREVRLTSTLPADAHFELAVEHLSNRRISDSLDHFHHAERLGSDPDECASGRWSCWMLLGEFEKAWQESDSLCMRGTPDPNRFWDGLPFTGKRVILRCLHGYGDAIQFMRYAPLIRREASYLIVETHPEMVSLFRGTPFIDEVITWTGPDKRSPEWDQQIEIMELPRAFRTTLQTIPNAVPYLFVGEQARERSRALLGGSGKTRVGILWASSYWNPARNIELAKWSPLLELTGFAFYSFQRGPEREELRLLNGNYEIYDTAETSPEIADTAADLTNMDLLITVDTMAAHLAGALGKPVWMLLPYHADWRWMCDREDTPWYPTMRLFRQPEPGDWDSVIARIAGELKAADWR